MIEPSQPANQAIHPALAATFCHIQGIGYVTEAKLWKRGVTTWADLMSLADTISGVSTREINRTLQDSLAAQDNDPQYFCRRLKNKDTWRLFPHFRKTTAYLDIETTGLGESSEITTIALYDGNGVRTYVNGRNLDDFINDLEPFNVLVTYNGIQFDIPFIERFFNTKINKAHIDLRYILAQLGCRGGLKGCERQMGINRGALDGIDGYFAVTLWHDYERNNNQQALNTLLAYNIEDTVNLERLLVEAYNRNLSKMLPLGEKYLLPCPEPPQIHFYPDQQTVDRLRRRHLL